MRIYNSSKLIYYCCYDCYLCQTLHAEAGIYDYWILNLVENHLEAYSEPYQDLQGKFGYSARKIMLPNQAIALPYLPDLFLDLSRVFRT